MATVEQETMPTSNPVTTEEEKTESIQEVANPEHYIKQPLQNRWALSSNLMPGCDYSLFKGGIEPMREDEKNKLGGRCNDVCGAVINVRAKGDKITIWTSECENREAVTHMGRVYKKRLGLPPKIVIGYQSHTDIATKSGSTTKNRFAV
uniref:Uncharacterized protein n=1 Tax=Nomascus leucogenys TaxID=61853 RepID=A0A2I3GKP1_NOMLE